MKYWIKRIMGISPLDLYVITRRKVRTLRTKLRKGEFETSDYIVISSTARWGNLLYFLLQSDITGKKILLPVDHKHTAWLKRFPAFENFVAYLPAETSLRPVDYFQFLGESFSYEQLSTFVQTYFLEDPEVIEYKENYHNGNPLYINVRRGDFYSVQRNESFFGYDIVGFLTYCFEEFKLGKQEKIVIISDDIQWCQAHLQFLSSYADEIVFLDLPPIEAFLVLATAKRMVISNSTFTYWAAYISTFIHRDDSEIYAPDFVCRIPGYGANKQYLPQWRVVKGFDCNSKEYLLSLIERSYD